MSAFYPRVERGDRRRVMHIGWAIHRFDDSHWIRRRQAPSIGDVDTLFKFPEINGPFRGSHALSEGWLTSKQLRSSLLKRLYRDVYVPSAMDVTHQMRCRAASLIVPPQAVITGLSAATLRGLDLTAADDPVELLIADPLKFIAQRGMDIRRTEVAEDECEPWGEIRVATPLRLALDVLLNTRLRRSLPRAVALLDALVRDGLVDKTLLEAVFEQRHDHGIVRARAALDLADPRAESIPESELRVWLRLGGLAPDVQLVVFDDVGRFLGRLDLGFLLYKLAVEFDGEWHRKGDQPQRDAERRARFRAAGWEFIVVTKDRLYGDPKGVVAEVHEAVVRRSSHHTGALPW